ncbi:TIGR02710 family CRISPR-associated protein, partial [Candidatus Bathyarchaeota archaeon]|nr:TIGR02710 family CRISPR-associated protein [Candidatus Bathyarchaeota archaeon]
MSRVLLMSVGTGVRAEPEASNGLAGALALSIQNTNPEIVYFITSRESRGKTLPKILSIITPPRCEIIEVTDPDKIQKVFTEVRPLMEKLRRENEHFAVDFTSGTKAMTGALAILGTLYEADVLCNIIGSRSGGIVQTGTEEVQIVKPIFAIAEKKLSTALEFFNACQYDASLSVIDDIEKRTKDEGILSRTDKLRRASKAYSAWDKFRHDEAFEDLKQLDDPAFNGNKRFLGRLRTLSQKNPNSPEAYQYYLADLYNNALRRGEVEKKYDDAVARLYRTTELLSQHQLETRHGIDSSNI